MEKAHYTELEQAIVEFVKEQRNERLTVTEKKIRRKAKLLFKELYPELKHDFKASRGWFRKMCRRNDFTRRIVTSVGQKVPKNAVEIAEAFLQKMKDIGQFAILANMDETPCYYDVPRSTTIDIKGVQTVKVKTTGAERFRFTAALTVGVKNTDDGYAAFRLPPLLIFKNLVKAPPGKYPPGLQILGSKGGTMKREMMNEPYVKRIWNR